MSTSHQVSIGISAQVILDAFVQFLELIAADSNHIVGGGGGRIQYGIGNFIQVFPLENSAIISYGLSLFQLLPNGGIELAEVIAQD